MSSSFSRSLTPEVSENSYEDVREAALQAAEEDAWAKLLDEAGLAVAEIKMRRDSAALIDAAGLDVALPTLQPVAKRLDISDTANVSAVLGRFETEAIHTTLISIPAAVRVGRLPSLRGLILLTLRDDQELNFPRAVADHAAPQHPIFD